LTSHRPGPSHSPLPDNSPTYFHIHLLSPPFFLFSNEERARQLFRAYYATCRDLHDFPQILTVANAALKPNVSLDLSRSSSSAHHLSRLLFARDWTLSQWERQRRRSHLYGPRIPRLLWARGHVIVSDVDSYVIIRRFLIIFSTDFWYSHAGEKFRLSWLAWWMKYKHGRGANAEHAALLCWSPVNHCEVTNKAFTFLLVELRRRSRNSSGCIATGFDSLQEKHFPWRPVQLLKYSILGCDTMYSATKAIKLRRQLLFPSSDVLPSSMFLRSYGTNVLWSLRLNWMGLEWFCCKKIQEGIWTR
jgi:hypothetical protein